MLGTHFLRAWSITQKSIVLSSGEAELVAMVKATAELIGMKRLMQEWGWGKLGKVYTDSSAALGIAKRKGSGRVRHVDVGLLWVQEKALEKEAQYHKVKGTENRYVHLILGAVRKSRKPQIPKYLENHCLRSILSPLDLPREVGAKSSPFVAPVARHRQSAVPAVPVRR